MAGLTAFQQSVADELVTNHRAGKGYTRLDKIAAGLRYQPAERGRLAVHSALRSLERQGLAGWYRSRDDQWGIMLWGPSRELLQMQEAKDNG